MELKLVISGLDTLLIFLLIAPLMELKLCSCALYNLIGHTFNRTAYGIETNVASQLDPEILSF